MKITNLRSRIIYGTISGSVYASTIALIDYFNGKEFDLIKFVFGIIIFGLAMTIAVKINKSQ